MLISINDFFLKLGTYVPSATHGLNPSADAALINKAEASIAHTLPPKLRKFYEFANGEIDTEDSVGLFMGLRVLSLDEALKQHQEMLVVSDMEVSGIVSAKPGVVRETYFHPGWLPIAADYGGNFLAVDFSPGENGRSGQIINCGRDEYTLYAIADSFDDFLEFILKQLENGKLQCQTAEEGSCYLEWESGHFFDDLADLAAGDMADAEAEDIWPALSPEWQEALKGALGKKPPTAANLAGISKVMMLRKSNLDLQPLKYLPNLRIFIGSASTFHDLTSLSRLTSLKELWIARTNVEELEFLTPIKTLNLLSISNTKVQDLGPLCELKQLKTLSLENLAAADYSPLQQLEKLVVLDVSGCVGLDVETIAGLKKLKELNISGLSYTSLDFLADFNQLNSLTLSECSPPQAVVQNPYEQLGRLPRLKFITCPYAVFEQTKDLVSGKVSYTIMGQMSEEQERCYHEYAVGER